MINDTIRIRLSLGLIVVAIVHAILLGVVFTALHNKPAQPQPEQSWTVPNYRPTAPSVGAIEKLQEPQSVNLQAQGEIKQQIRNCPPNCLPQRVYPAPVVVQPTIVQPTVMTPTVTPTVAQPVPVTPNFVDVSKQTQEPLVVTPVSNPAAPPPKKSYQIALFVNPRCDKSATAGMVHAKQATSGAQGKLRVPGLHGNERDLQDSLRRHCACGTVPCGSLPRRNRRAHPRRWSINDSEHAGRALLGFASWLHALQASQRSAEDWSSENQRLLLGRCDHADAVSVGRGLSRWLLPKRHPRKTVDHWIECAISSTERRTLATHCFGSRPARSPRSHLSESQPCCSCSF